LQRGYLGVSLFFVISGFLITTLLLRENATHGDISLKRFYIRRTLRIFPLYYTVLLLYVLLVLLLESDTPVGRAFFANLPYFATYTSNWFVPLTSDRVIFYFVWSLAAEEQFYLVWPTIEKLLRPVGAVIFMLFVLGMVALILAGATDSSLPPGTLAHTILTSFPIPIGLGVLLAHVLHNKHGYALAASLFGRRFSVLLAALVVGVLLTQHQLSLWWVYFAMTALVASTVIREDHSLARLLRWRPIAHIGVVSYGMYLLHMLASKVAEKILNYMGGNQPLTEFVMTVVVAVTAATVSYRYYESFFLRLKDRYAGR
jgi:peptidoglycan/LPS O-acetylase OafA/YrhL